MRILFDSNVLVAAMAQDHRAHQRAYPYFEQALNGTVQGFLSTHALAETFSILTTLPIRPIITPALAQQALASVQDGLALVPLDVEDYREALGRMVKFNIPGGGVYDALHAQAAVKSEVDILLTLSPKHFTRLGNEIAARVRVP